jgi:hypothetical protein
MVKIKNRTSPPVGHLGRRLLNEPSYDTDTDTSSMQTPVESDEEFNSFLKVDNDELSKQLFKFEVTAGGSGESMLTLKNWVCFSKNIFLFFFYSNGRYNRTNNW